MLRRWGEFQQTHPLTVAPICTDIPFTVGTDLGSDAVAETLVKMRMATAVGALVRPVDGQRGLADPRGAADRGGHHGAPTLWSACQRRRRAVASRGQAGRRRRP